MTVINETELLGTFQGGGAICTMWILVLCTGVVCYTAQRKNMIHLSRAKRKSHILHIKWSSSSRYARSASRLHFIWKRKECKFNNCQAGPGLEWFRTCRAFTEYWVGIVDMSHQLASRESYMCLSAGQAPSESAITVPEAPRQQCLKLSFSSKWHLSWC